MDGNAININSQGANLYWNLLKGLSSDIKLELIARLSSSLIKKRGRGIFCPLDRQFCGKVAG
jgi:hypothetical protein